MYNKLITTDMSVKEISQEMGWTKSSGQDLAEMVYKKRGVKGRAGLFIQLISRCTQ